MAVVECSIYGHEIIAYQRIKHIKPGSVSCLDFTLCYARFSGSFSGDLRVSKRESNFQMQTCP